VSTASSVSRASVLSSPISVRRSVSNDLPSPKDVIAGSAKSNANRAEMSDRKLDCDINIDEEDLQILGSAPPEVGIFGKNVHAELAQR